MARKLKLAALAALLCLSASAQDEDAEPVRARVLCDGSRLAAIQILAPRAGVITIAIPRNVCGRSA